jgi:hypothetical protein
MEYVACASRIFFVQDSKFIKQCNITDDAIVKILTSVSYVLFKETKPTCYMGGSRPHACRFGLSTVTGEFQYTSQAFSICGLTIQ